VNTNQGAVTVKRNAVRERRAQAELAVLDAVRELLGEGAQFGDLTIEQIAGRAGISRPAFYGHFVDKGALLIRLIDAVIEPVYLRAEEQLEALPSGPDYADDALRTVALLLVPEIALIRSVIQASTTDTEVAARWQQTNQRVIDAISRRIRGQQEAGLALPGDADDLSYVLVTLTLAGLGLFFGGEAPERQQALIETVVTVWRRAVYGTK
jgi:AcrR family transcriptional regulator